jgi:TonB family protein
MRISSYQIATLVNQISEPCCDPPGAPDGPDTCVIAGTCYTDERIPVFEQPYEEPQKMNWGWQREFKAALLEKNRLAAAQKIIIQRLQELAGADEEMPEVQALREALESLYGVSPGAQFRPGELADEEQHHRTARKQMRIGTGICGALMVVLATAWMIHKRTELNQFQKLRAVEAAQVNTSPSKFAESLGGPPGAASSDPVAHRSASSSSNAPGRIAHGAARVPDRNANTNKPDNTAVDGRADSIFAGAAPVTSPVQSSANDQSETAAPADASPDGTAQAQPTTVLSNEPQEKIQSAPSSLADTQERTPPAEPDTNKKQADEKPQSTPPEVTQQTSETRQGEIRQGSISIETRGYPSIRIPPELKQEAARSGASLQIGEPVARVAPLYPEDAERQGVEGTVKLRVVITKDGAVQNLEVLAGPSLLATAAVNAIRQWHYRPTLLGDQPVEVVEEITVVFRITNTSARAN